MQKSVNGPCFTGNKSTQNISHIPSSALQFNFILVSLLLGLFCKVFRDCVCKCHKMCVKIHTEMNKNALFLYCSSTALTITAVSQVGPDDVFLWKAEHSKTASSHTGINNNSRVCNHVGTFIELYSVQKQKHNKHVAFSHPNPVKSEFSVFTASNLMYPTWGLCFRFQR